MLPSAPGCRPRWCIWSCRPRIALIAASLMLSGVSKSGSPAQANHVFARRFKIPGLRRHGDGGRGLNAGQRVRKESHGFELQVGIAAQNYAACKLFARFQRSTHKNVTGPIAQAGQVQSSAGSWTNTLVTQPAICGTFGEQPFIKLSGGFYAIADDAASRQAAWLVAIGKPRLPTEFYAPGTAAKLGSGQSSIAPSTAS